MCTWTAPGDRQKASQRWWFLTCILQNPLIYFLSKSLFIIGGGVNQKKKKKAKHAQLSAIPSTLDMSASIKDVLWSALHLCGKSLLAPLR